MKAQIRRLSILLLILVSIFFLISAIFCLYEAHLSQIKIDRYSATQAELIQLCQIASDTTVPPKLDASIEAAILEYQEWGKAVEAAIVMGSHKSTSNEIPNVLTSKQIICQQADTIGSIVSNASLEKNSLIQRAVFNLGEVFFVPCLTFIGLLAFKWAKTGENPFTDIVVFYDTVTNLIANFRRARASSAKLRKAQSLSEKAFWISTISDRQQADKIIKRSTVDFLRLYAIYTFLISLNFWITGQPFAPAQYQLGVRATIFLFIATFLTIIVRRNNSRVAAGFLALSYTLPNVLFLIAIGFALVGRHVPFSTWDIFTGVLAIPFILFDLLASWMAIRTFIATLKLRNKFAAS